MNWMLVGGSLFSSNVGSEHLIGNYWIIQKFLFSVIFQVNAFTGFCQATHIFKWNQQVTSLLFLIH